MTMAVIGNSEQLKQRKQEVADELSVWVLSLEFVLEKIKIKLKNLS